MDAAHPQAVVSGVPAPETAKRGARLWPALAIVVLMWLGYVLPGILQPGTFFQFMGLMWAPMIGGALLLLWWLFFSRVPWSERFFGLGALVLTGAAAFTQYHESVAFGGMGLIIYAMPVALTAWIAWMVCTPSLSPALRRVGMVAVLAVAWGYFALIRLDGLDGSFHSETSFRWQPTKEESFLAARTAPGETTKKEPAEEKALALQPGDWPAFRGTDRDARVPGLLIGTDWAAHPPKELWRKKVGPGWSSFCVVGGFVYTQEQWGGKEAVVCYQADTGTQVWAHTEDARFTELVAGPGPRATPTFADGKLFVLGATGLLQCLDARTGAAVWTHDIKADMTAEPKPGQKGDPKIPMWGFSASPLVAKGIVSVFAGGSGKAVLGYDAAKGTLAWSAAKGEFGYCSMQLAKVAGVEQILASTDAGLFGLDPESGKELWSHDWPLKGMVRVIQPAVVNGSDLLFGSPFGMGLRRLHLEVKDGAWTVTQAWQTRALSPYFNDLVVHKDCLYGFTTTIFTCIGLEDGKEKWHVSGYGNGQVLLLPDQNLLLLLSEKGDVCLLQADPAGHKEIARIKAIEGKTWNHPVVAHGKLFVRNGEEAACFQLEVDPASTRP